jgi:PEGA domain-containing protein
MTTDSAAAKPDRDQFDDRESLNSLQRKAEPAVHEDIVALSDAFLPLGEPEPPIAVADIPDVAVGDLDLHVAEMSRYEAVESSSGVEAFVFDRLESQPSSATPLAAPAAAAGLVDPALVRPGSAVWPLVLALVIGVAIGAAAMVVFLHRDRASILASESPVASQAPPTATAAVPVREFTEVTAVKSTTPHPEVRRTPDATAGRGLPGPTGPLSPTSGVPLRPTPTAPRTARGRSEPDRAAPAAVGRLLVRSTPAGARVFLDGKDAGATPMTLRGLTRGSHSVRLVREGYAPAERTVSFTAARPAQSLIVELPRPSATSRVPVSPPSPSALAGRYTGSLGIASLPPGATVYIDGKEVGTTPLRVPAIDAGSHVVRLERDGYGRWTSAVRVVAGEQMRVTASLER